MERDFAGSRVGRVGFQRLATLCAGDPKFPANYDEWLRLVGEGERQTIAEGKDVVGLDIDPADFEAWCCRVSIHRCFDALRAYLIVTRRAIIAAQGRAHLSASDSVKPKKNGSSADQRSRAVEMWARLFEQRLRAA